MLERFPRDPAVLRTTGLVELHTGDVRVGMRLLQTSWRAAEPLWLRALCALYLALGHAMRGDHNAARRWLRKAKRLHPECVLLPDYEARIRAAALPAAGAPAP